MEAFQPGQVGISLPGMGGEGSSGGCLPGLLCPQNTKLGGCVNSLVGLGSIGAENKDSPPESSRPHGPLLGGFGCLGPRTGLPNWPAVCQPPTSPGFSPTCINPLPPASSRSVVLNLPQGGLLRAPTPTRRSPGRPRRFHPRPFLCPKSPQAHLFLYFAAAPREGGGILPISQT